MLASTLPSLDLVVGQPPLDAHCLLPHTHNVAPVFQPWDCGDFKLPQAQLAECNLSNCIQFDLYTGCWPSVKIQPPSLKS